jgi:capsular polysaccharide export protein
MNKGGRAAPQWPPGDASGCMAGKKVLLLQGPVGPFFHGLAQDLRAAGAEVHKVNFNGGDQLFYWRGAQTFRGTLEQWPSWLKGYILEHGIEIILLFGDCRPVHRCVDALAQEHHCLVGVFEEGYVRPHYVTFELHGVNGHSGFALQLNILLEHEREVRPQVPVERTFWCAAWCAMGYFFAAWLSQAFWNNRLHHRWLSIWEGLFWLRSFARKRWFAWRERAWQSRLTGPLAGHYFLVPLQVYNDAQVHVHSPYEDIPNFIAQIIQSFAQARHSHRKAMASKLLVFKHHPMDRGHVAYGSLIAQLARAYGVSEQVVYLHDQHLPTLLRHARGVVVINSTVGLSALHHGAPTLVCGSAIYDLPGLTFQGEKEAFWMQAQQAAPDKAALQRFTHSLIAHTQLNGSFYRNLAVWGTCSGIDLSGFFHNLERGLRIVQSQRPCAGIAAVRVGQDSSLGAEA